MKNFFNAIRTFMWMGLNAVLIWSIVIMYQDNRSMASEYIIYASNYSKEFSSTNDFDNEYAFTVPSDAPSNDVYIIWPTNSYGAGEPIVLNKPELWWIGPDDHFTYTNSQFSVYGRNLELDGTSYVYCAEEDELLSTTDCNPYRATYTIPSYWTIGQTNTIWTHNGHGGKYGWSEDSKELIVAPVVDWSAGTTLDVTAAPYYAIPDDANDDYAAIYAALLAANAGDTIYFPAGTYLISQNIADFNRGSGADNRLRLIMGDGTNTIIKPYSSFSSSYLILDYLTDTEIKDIVFDSGDKDLSVLFRIRSCNNVKFDNVTFTQEDQPTTTKQSWNPIDQLHSSYMYFTNCTFIQRHNIYGSDGRQIFFDDCEFIGIDDANAFWNGDASEVSIVNSYAHPIDLTETNDASLRCAGRWYVAQGVAGTAQRNLYFGDNVTKSMATRSGASDQNEGEQFLMESLHPLYYGNPSSITSNSLVLSDLSSDYTGSVIAITKGQGRGQHNVISSWDGGTHTVTLEKNWRYAPDTNSTVIIGEFGKNVAIYNNHFNGHQRVVDTSSDIGSAGVEFYGSVFNAIVDGNTMDTVQSGIENWSLSSTLIGSYRVAEPNYFNLFTGNTITNVRHGIQNRGYGFTPSASVLDGRYLVGNVFRKNYIADMPQNQATAWAMDFLSWATNYSQSLTIYDQNTFSNAAVVYHYYGDPWPEGGGWNNAEAPLTNLIFIGNTAMATDTGIIYSAETDWYDETNTWNGATHYLQ